MHNEESYYVKCPKCFREMTSLNRRSFVMVRAVNSKKETWGGYVCCLCVDSMTMAEVVRVGNEYRESVFRKYEQSGDEIHRIMISGDIKQ